MPVPLHLHDFAKRPPLESEQSFDPNNALIAHDPGFRGLSIRHYDYQRDESLIGEMHPIHFAMALMKNLVMLEFNVFQAWPDRSEIAIAEREQKPVLDGLPFRAGSFAGPKWVGHQLRPFDRCNVGRVHGRDQSFSARA